MFLYKNKLIIAAFLANHKMRADLVFLFFLVFFLQIFKITILHTSYIFKVNKLTRSTLDAVYKKFLPTFLGAFSMLLSNFKNLRIQQASANLQQVIEELLNWS